MEISRPAFSRRTAFITTAVSFSILITLTFLQSTSAASIRGLLRLDKTEIVPAGQMNATSPAANSDSQVLLRSRLPMTPLTTAFLPFFAGESIATYAANCSTPKTSFNLGDTVCARAVGAPPPFFGFARRRFAWADPIPLTRQTTDITTDPQTDLFILPSTQTSTVAGITVDNRGVWRVNDTSGIDGTVIASAFFTVSSPAAPTVDLEVSTTVNPNTATPSANSTVEFDVFIRNNGPDTAANVSLTNPTPANTLWLSLIKDPAFTCVNPSPGSSGTSTCTVASLPSGSTAIFRYSYSVELNVPNGTVLTDLISITSSTADKNTANNSSSADAIVNTSPCTITPAQTNISQNNDLHQGGAIVTYSQPTASQGCGQVDCELPSGAFFPVGINTVTCTTDTGDFARFTVTVNDTEAPTITCPANVTAPENPHGSGSAFVSFPDPQATDNGPVTVTLDHPSGSNFPLGPTTVTATATDVSNNTVTCTFTVTVIPSDCTLTCPSNIVQQPDAGQNGAIVNYSPATTTGTTCGTVSYSQDSGSFFPLGVTTVFVRAASGEACSFTVNITTSTDTTPPTITCPADVTQAATSGCSATVSVGTPTATDDNPGVTTSGSRSDGQPLTAPYQVGETIITWTATDASGNTATCNQSVKVTESVAPSVTAPAPVSVNVNSSCDQVEVPNFINGLVASDNCTPRANLEISQSPAVETLVGVGSHTITITVKDTSGNTTVVTTTFNVVDNIPPTITLNGPSSVTVECHTSFTDPGASATDNCAGTFAATASGNVDVNVPGTYTITYNASDPSGNAATPVTRTVTVVDTTPPSLALNGASAMTVECHTSFTDPGATATDSCDTAVAVTVTGSVNVNVPGVYTLTYNAHDASGNAATPVSRTVTVVDTTAPTLTLNGVTPSLWPPNHSYHTFNVTDFVASASDSCDTSVGVGSVYITKVTSDEAENGNGDGNTLNDIIIAANCKSVQLRAERDGSGDGRVYTITFKVVDASGNSTTGTAKVVVPKSQNGSAAVDSGPHYTVNSGCQ